MMCYRGSCTNNSVIFNNAVDVKSCNPNPCQNNGKCVPKYDSNIFVCDCSETNGFTGS